MSLNFFEIFRRFVIFLFLGLIGFGLYYIGLVSLKFEGEEDFFMVWLIYFRLKGFLPRYFRLRTVG